MNGNTTLSPRIAFNYTLPTERKTQIRGGAGLFLGSFPVVWYENAFNNAGQLASYTVTNGSAPIANYTFTGNTATQPLPPVSVTTPLESFDIIDPKYKYPANWKENIAIDHELPFWHLILTAEVDTSQVQEDSILYDLNLKQGVAGAPAYMPDGAIRYAGNITPTNIGSQYFAPGYTTSNLYVSSTGISTSALAANPATGPVYKLTNTNKGGTQEYSVYIKRPMIDGWAFSLAYDHMHATQVDPSPSSVASSNYDDNVFVNPNDNKAYVSEYEVPDKVVATVAHQFKFFPYHNTTTTLSAQFIYQTGEPYSFVFKGVADGWVWRARAYSTSRAGPTTRR